MFSELHSRKQHNFSRDKFQGRHKNYKFKSESPSIHKKPQKKVCKVIPQPNVTQTLNPFAGIQNIIIDDNQDEEIDESLQNSLIEDDDIYPEEGTNNVNDKLQIEPTVCGALSSLMNEYGSSDEDNVVNNASNSSSKQAELTKKEIKKQTVDKKLPMAVDVNKSDDDSGPEEAIITKSTTDVEQNGGKNLRPKFEKRPRSPPIVRNFKKPKYQLPSTLLVKLLSREIEQERNIILQCVRHIVKNKYFDDTSTKD